MIPVGAGVVRDGLLPISDVSLQLRKGMPETKIDLHLKEPQCCSQ